MRKRSLFCFLNVILTFLLSIGADAGIGKTDDQRIKGFEKRLDELREELKIPAISAGIVKEGKLGTRKPIAEILDVKDNEDRTSEFILEDELQVRIFALGEGVGGEMYDYGWIEDAERNEELWVMREPETTHAGGAGKNRMAEKVITLPAGRYRLRYTSDESHSFNHWNSTPPDYRFWGISVYPEIQ